MAPELDAAWNQIGGRPLCPGCGRPFTLAHALPVRDWDGTQVEIVDSEQDADVLWCETCKRHRALPVEIWDACSRIYGREVLFDLRDDEPGPLRQRELFP